MKNVLLAAAIACAPGFPPSVWTTTDMPIQQRFVKRTGFDAAGHPTPMDDTAGASRIGRLMGQLVQEMAQQIAAAVPDGGASNREGGVALSAPAYEGAGSEPPYRSGRGPDAVHRGIPMDTQQFDALISQLVKLNTGMMQIQALLKEMQSPPVQLRPDKDAR